MKPSNDFLNAELLVRLQRGLPLVTRPFQALGSELGLAEDAVLAQVQALFETGLGRRLGGVFDGRRLGYDSMLVAAEVPDDALPDAATRVTPQPGVTHCYARDGRPNLWFTVTAPVDRLPAVLAQLTAALAPWPTISLPARRTFKIGVVLDLRRLEGGTGAPPEDPAGRSNSPGLSADSMPPATQSLAPAERELVRRLQHSLPLVAAPFAALAAELGWREEALLARLARWQQAGVLRRVCLVLHHRAAGFHANALCAWRVADDRLATAGRVLARGPEITHCYERAPHPLFPFNLFAMLHADTRPATEAAALRLAAAAGLCHGRLLFSTREFKKSSPVFFAEDSI